jgi:hypothetical protein
MECGGLTPLFCGTTMFWLCSNAAARLSVRPIPNLFIVLISTPTSVLSVSSALKSPSNLDDALPNWRESQKTYNLLPA